MDGPVTQEATEVDDGRSGTVIWRRSPEAKAKRLVRQLAVSASRPNLQPLEQAA